MNVCISMAIFIIRNTYLKLSVSFIIWVKWIIHYDKEKHLQEKLSQFISSIVVSTTVTTKMVQISSKFIKLHFNHKKPESFVRSQCQSEQRSAFFLTFRWLLAAFFIGGIAYTWTNNIKNGTFGFWFIYMTNWGLFICTISTIYAAILTTFHYVKKLDLNFESRSYKILWWLSNVSTVLAFEITLVYWIILFEGNLKRLSINVF